MRIVRTLCSVVPQPEQDQLLNNKKEVPPFQDDDVNVNIPEQPAHIHTGSMATLPDDDCVRRPARISEGEPEDSSFRAYDDCAAAVPSFVRG